MAEEGDSFESIEGGNMIAVGMHRVRADCMDAVWANMEGHQGSEVS